MVIEESLSVKQLSLVTDTHSFNDFVRHGRIKKNSFPLDLGPIARYIHVATIFIVI